MKSLQRRFNNITNKNPNWSFYLCFAEAVRGQKFNKQTIYRWFQKLIDKNDYAKSEKRAILTHLVSLTNTSEDNRK